jgi:benzodiazapine receptor
VVIFNKIIVWCTFYACTLIAVSAGFVFPLGNNSEFFTSLNEPMFAPPNWIFGPIWTILYILIATSAYRITQQTHKYIPIVIALWTLQIALNIIWVPIFAGAENLEVAFYYIIALWISIIFYILASWKVDKWASIMFIPYFVWISFASVLNYSYWQLNI